MDLMNLVIAGVLFVVLGFSLTIGQNILDQNTRNICQTVGGSWTDNVSGTAGRPTNPYTGGFSGCCLAKNTTHPTVCDNFTTTSYALNTSYYSATSVNTLAYWLPIIALAVAAGFVISILIIYLLGSVTGRTSASV